MNFFLLENWKSTKPKQEGDYTMSILTYLLNF